MTYCKLNDALEEVDTEYVIDNVTDRVVKMEKTLVRDLSNILSLVKFSSWARYYISTIYSIAYSENTATAKL